MTSSQRMPPLTSEAWTPEMRSVFTMLEGPDAYETGSKSNVILTLARNPKLASAFFKFNAGLLMRGGIAPALRELMILRVAWLHRARYEWAQHVRVSLMPDALSPEATQAFRRGEPLVEDGPGLLTRAQIEAVKQGAGHPVWTELEALVLRAVDELKDTSRIGDPTWAGLSRHLDEQQLIELVFIIGSYSLLAYVMNTLDIEPEPAQLEFLEPHFDR